MKILGNRILITRIEEPKKEGFSTVEVQDSFVYKGKVEIIGNLDLKIYHPYEGGVESPKINTGDTVLFAKYSPDTQEVDYEGAKAKIIRIEDILAVF